MYGVHLEGWTVALAHQRFDKHVTNRDKQKTIQRMSKKGELDLAAAERVGRDSK